MIKNYILENKVKIYPGLIAFILGLSFIPALAGPAVAQAADATVQSETALVIPDQVILQNFPVYAQEHTLSCEYASTRMITAYWNMEISEDEFIQSIPLNPNPHLGYRGNIDGWFGGTDQYGIYLEPIANYLDTRGFSTKLLDGTADAVKAELALGHPVQVIIIAGMGWSTPFTAESDGLTYQLAAGEHSVVLYGYDANGVYVADPGYGTSDYYSWATFLRSWSYLGNMAMAVWPESTQTLAVTNETPGIAAYFYRSWINNGGATILGDPIADVQTQGSKVYQYFANARLEYNLDQPITQQVTSGLLGTELTQGRRDQAPFQPVAKPSESDPNVSFFDATGHSIILGFKDFWEQNGGLAVFGYPISQEFEENGHTVQYFERVRFEYFPDNPAGSQVQLGALGTERLNVKAPV